MYFKMHLTLDRRFGYCGSSNVNNRYHVARTSLTLHSRASQLDPRTRNGEALVNIRTS